MHSETVAGSDKHVVHGDVETEADGYQLLEQLRWGPDGPANCPHCGAEKGAWFLKSKDPEGRKSKGGTGSRSHRRVWKCKACRRQFSVLTSTGMHATKMPVQAWIGAVSDLCSIPGGVSTRELAARWGVAEKSAWTMLERIQDALVEVDSVGTNSESNTSLLIEVAMEPAGYARQKAAAQAFRRAEVEAASQLRGSKNADLIAAIEKAEADAERMVASAGAEQEGCAQSTRSTPR